MFSLRLKGLREGLNISQQTFASKLGVSQSTVGMWESGKREPNFTTIEKIADYFNVTTDYLLGRTDDKNQKPGEENITFDDFTYAMHNETQNLTDDDKQMLIDMARMLKNRINEKKALENPQK